MRSAIKTGTLYNVVNAFNLIIVVFSSLSIRLKFMLDDLMFRFYIAYRVEGLKIYGGATIRVITFPLLVYIS